MPGQPIGDTKKEGEFIMARLPVVTYEKADVNTQKNYDNIKSKFGMVPNIFKGMANSPVALNAYLKLDEMIAGGNFSPVEQDIVRMVVSQYNNCNYCIAAHTIGLSSKGIGKEEILSIRKGHATDPKHSALVDFTLKVIKTKGFVSDSDLDSFINAGFTNIHAAELAVIIAQKTLSNYFNHINDTDLDLPVAPAI
jgi:uncharacterized peroxidase-related enzyme